MKSIFEEFNETLRKKLIALYEDFIENFNKEILKKNAASITQKYANSGSYNLTSEVALALESAYKIELGNLSVIDAKKILKELKKSK